MSYVQYLDISLEKDNQRNLKITHYDKRGFSIVIFFLLMNVSNILSSPGSGVVVSQLIRYARSCYTFEQFLKMRQATDKRVYITRLSTVLIKVIFP